MDDGLKDYQMLLGDYIRDIQEQVAQALMDFENNYSAKGWKTASVTITTRGVLKPVKVNGKRTVVVDLDEPKNIAGEFSSEIPISIVKQVV